MELEAGEDFHIRDSAQFVLRLYCFYALYMYVFLVFSLLIRSIIFVNKHGQWIKK